MSDFHISDLDKHPVWNDLRKKQSFYIGISQPTCKIGPTF